MGVPKFYRWISERYPQINQMISGSNILPEFDNFYLDMNGIIHACTHPNDNQTANSLTLREMILAIFRYIDRMVTEIVKPKKILFMAIDGVAPRAKLNQQRARRFRAAQDREESIVKARQRGETVDEEAMFDSNCITPGTEFMEIVGKHLRWFIRKKVKEDPLWRNLKIVFSGHDVPGEGEHKIMQFIRDLRVDPNYEPNQRHCMYGQDADLIMLGLASHEPHFALLREVVDFSGGRPAAGGKQTVIRQTKDAQFQLLHLSILREYLTLDFALDCTWNPDQERLIDDFIFLTFLVGNDFLPHLPTLDIGEHAFDLLISSYRQLMNASPGYIVLNGDIGDLARLEQLFQIIGQQENQILVARAEEVKTTNKKRRKYKDQVVASDEELEEAEDLLQRAYEAAIQVAIGKTDADAGAEDGEWTGVSRGKGEEGTGDDDRDSEDDDEEKVVAKDYRGRYYYEKFKVVPSTPDGKALLDDVMAQYLKGLVWVLAYYVKGCISWTWYYPYHYGPMLQDMHELEQMTQTFSFELGQPFLPFQQLLGCLPPASTNLLPRLYQWLMVSNESPVREFYPLEFGIDQDGKKNPWEAVVLLDFIDEVKLLQAEALHCPADKLSQVERNRNVFGKVLTCLFAPGNTDTYFSCNPEFGLPDIHCCNSVVSESTPSLSPGAYFKPELILGTTYPIAGFPSLTVLPLMGCKVEAVKVNMFGSDSKYKSVVIELQCPKIDQIDALNAELLLGRIVYVNYPQVHEARVVAVTNETEEYRMERVKGVDGVESVSVTHKKYDEMATQRWKKEAHEEEAKYLKGRGTPGSGGLVVGEIKIRLRVCPLQGLQRDPISGASKKIYATTSEADIPIQLALWTPPVHDTRFEECDEMSVEALMPVGSNVLALSGQLLGCKGRVVGPHAAGDASKSSLLKTDTKRLKRVVDVEFSLPQPEPPFGYSIASSVVEEFFSTKDLCASLQMSPSVLGKLVGSIKLDVNRADIGLSLKRNGQYQLLGFAHRIEPGEAGAYNQRKVWTGADTIQIVGTVADGADMDAAAEADGCYWEYSVRAATLIFDYKMRFPKLFHNLERLPHQSVYNADELLGGDGKTKTEEITSWLAAQAYFKMPRTAFSTTSLSRFDFFLQMFVYF
jgi:5'-3' exoribonuclease 1